MAQDSYYAERSRGRGRGREGRGRRDFGDMREHDRGPANYHLRSRDTGYQGYHSNEYSTRHSGSSEYSEGSKGMWKGDTKLKNVEYFWRMESPFSQFHPANFDIKNGSFVCAEQYMMSNKARVFSDYKSLRLIMEAKEPRIMKKYGRGVENFDSGIWDMCCRQVVQEGNTAKFSQNCALLEKMLSTESKYFAEASPGDKKWGIGIATNNPLSNNPSSWGSNWLGEALNTVKYEFQLIIFLAMNGDFVKQAPKPTLFDLFKIGTCEYFEKMKCEILIKKSEEEIFIDAPSRNRSGKGENKKYKQTKIDSKMNEKEESLAPNFDVQLPKDLVVQKEQLESTKKVVELENVTEKMDTEVESTKQKSTSNLGENISDGKGNKIEPDKDECVIKSEVSESGEGESKNKKSKEKFKNPKETDEENKDRKRESKKNTSGGSKQKQSPIAKRKSPQEYTQEKITFDSNPVPKSNVPRSKRISCEYIFTDWAREMIRNDVTVLNCFMRLSVEDIHNLKGNFVYQTYNEVINIGISVSSLLIKLHTEFNDLAKKFRSYSDYIKNFDCATKLSFPPSIKERVHTDTRYIWLNPDQPYNLVRRNTGTPEDKSGLSALESKKTTQDKPVIQFPKNTEKSQATPDIPIKEAEKMLQEKSDNSLEVKILDKPNTPIENNPDNPPAGDTETENIPVTTATSKVTDVIQESSTGNNKPENEQEDIKTEDSETGMEQEIIEVKNTEIPQATPVNPNTGDVEMVQKSSFMEVKTTANIPDTQIDNNPTAGDTGIENIPVTTATLEEGTGVMQESSIEENKPENEQENINTENSQTGMEQETINVENTELPQATPDIPIVEDLKMTQEKSDNSLEVKILDIPNIPIENNPDNPPAGDTETENIPVATATSKVTDVIQESSTGNNKPENEQEDIAPGNLASAKEHEITQFESTETNINKSDNTSASEMDISTELISETNIISPLPDEEFSKEEQKPKTKKSLSKSPDEIDTAKRPKHDTEKLLVPYDSSTNSDQDSAENQKESKSQTGESLESLSPVENDMNEDEPKEKPTDSSAKPSKGKKKKKKTILSTGLRYHN